MNKIEMLVTNGSKLVKCYIEWRQSLKYVEVAETCSCDVLNIILYLIVSILYKFEHNENPVS